MDTIKALSTRRSIRKFKASAIEIKLLQEIVNQGLMAPSSKNTQPWRLHVVTDRNTNNYISKLLLSSSEAGGAVPLDPKTGERLEKYIPTSLESIAVLESAPVSVYIENIGPYSGGRNNILNSKHLKESIYSYEFEMVGIGAAIENILLAAHAYGLGGVFMGDVVIEKKSIEEYLGMKGDLLGVIALGNPAQTKLWDKPLEKDRIIWH